MRKFRGTMSGMLIIAGIVAFCSKPDEACFRRYLVRQSHRMPMTVVQRMLVRTQLEMADIEFHDFGFVTGIVIHDEQEPMYFVGWLGRWTYLAAKPPAEESDPSPSDVSKAEE